MDDVLSQLKAGIRRFRSDVYPARATVFQKAASTPQTPRALFITCADSRIDPELITNSSTGDLFVTRNVGNMIPQYGEMLGGVSAVIEYAVIALKVKHIVICGHTECGAMAALLDPTLAATMPTVQTWLHNATAALATAEALAKPEESAETLARRLTEENVLLQLLHLRSHPSVAAGLARGDLSVSGWVYNIGSGEVRITDDGSRAFHPVEVE